MLQERLISFATGDFAKQVDITKIGVGVKFKPLRIVLVSHLNGRPDGALQNRRHSTYQDEIHLRADQRRNDLREINGHHFSLAAFRPPAAVLQPFATRANAFARVVRTSASGFRATMCDPHRA
jgi:hypothetical protein